MFKQLHRASIMFFVLTSVGYKVIGQIDSVILDSVNKLIEQYPSDTAVANAYISLADVYYLENPDTIIPLSKHAIALIEKYIDHVDSVERDRLNGLKALALNNIGYVHEDRGRIALALEYYYAGLTLEEECHNKIAMAATLNNIGIIYDDLGEIENALKYYNLSLDLERENQNLIGIAYTLNNLGYCHTMRGDAESSKPYYHESFKILTELNDIHGMAYCLNNLGFIYLEESDTIKAFECFRKALTYRKGLHDQEGTSSSLFNLARYYDKIGLTDSSVWYGEAAFKLASEIVFPSIVQVSASHLQQLYRKKGRWQDALTMQDISYAMLDSMQNAKTQKAVIRQGLNYEFEKKEAIRKLEQQKKDELTLAHDKKQQIISLSLGGGLLSLIVVAFLLIRGLKHKQKANTLILKQKEEVEKQRDIVSVQNKEILDSIQYAKRIQQAILPPIEDIKKTFKEVFIFYQPKAIVAGDFYWMEEIDELIYFAVADCTGHGVPGAMVSVMCSNALTVALREDHLRKPSDILDRSTEILINRFEKSEEEMKDGMDISICCLNSKTNELQFAGANNPLWICSKMQTATSSADESHEDSAYQTFFIKEIKGNKQPVGNYAHKKPFINHQIQLQEGDSLYLFSDGYADQFGGERGKKLKYKPFKDIFLNMQHKSMNEQLEVLTENFSTWKNNLEQIDDVCIMGIKI